MKQLTLLFILEDDSVLLAMKKRGFGAGRWNGVGGKLDEGETIEEALVRECQEEISVTPTQYKKMAEILFDEHHNGERSQMQVHVYVCEAYEGEPKESEEMAPEWYKLNELPFDEMWPDDPYWLPQVLDGKKLKATFVLDEHDAITSHEVLEVDSF